MVTSNQLTHTIRLGPRTRHVVRIAARFLNPLVVLVAGRRWMPILGILHHRGRRSGRAYATPLGMRHWGNYFVMPRTFGEDAAWYRNVLAARGCSVKYLGNTYTLTEPDVIDYAAAAPAFPRYERLQFRLIGINEYLRLRIADSAGAAGRAPQTRNLGVKGGIRRTEIAAAPVAA